MKVLSCYQPAADPVTFSPSQEPLVVFSAGHTLCVATTQRNVEVYELDGEQCTLIQTFSTAGLVKQGVFNSTGDYITVLEVRERNQAANVRIYSNWQNSLSADSPVKARIAGQAPSTSSWDLLNPHPFELIELPLRTTPKCLNCCLLTGNVVVGLSTSLAVFKFVVHNKGTDTEYKDFTHLLDVVVSFPVREVAITQQYVAYASSHQLHCFKLMFGDWTKDKIGVKTTPKDGVKDVKDQKSSDQGKGPKVSPTSGDGSGKDPGVTWNFGSAGYTIPEMFMKPIRQPCASSVLLSSVKHEKLYHDDAKDPVEILGPKEKVKGHPVQVKWNEVYLYSEGGLSGSHIQVSIMHLLYRKFHPSQDDVSEFKQGPIHSLQLLPNYKKDDETQQEELDPLGTSQKPLQSLCCFISTTNDGYLYNVLETPALLSQYSYKADALSVKAGHSLLYALTQNGLEIYTMRSFAAAFQRLDARDDNILASPPVDLEVCMVGLLPWINITHLSVSINHITLLSKTKQPTSPSRNTASRPVKSWNIQVLHKAAIEEVYNAMLSLGQRYQESSKEAYLQLLQEGHIILKGSLLLSIDAKQDFTSLLDRSHFNSTMASLQQLFLKTCALLAQYYSRPDVEDSHLAAPYFKMSELSLHQILEMFTLQDDDDSTSKASPAGSFSLEEADEDETPILVAPGPGLIDYLDGMLFGEEKPLDLDVDEKLCNTILDIYGKVAADKLSQLILLSMLKDSLSPSKAMESLQKLNTLTGYKQSSIDILTSVWLYIQLGDLEQAHSLLGMLNIDEISQLLADHPELLYQSDKMELTFLAQLIKQQEPESLFEAMLQLLDQEKLPLTTCSKLLQVCFSLQLIKQQEPESLFEAMLQLLDQEKLRLTTCSKLLQTDKSQPLHSNTHHRQFLELVLAQKHRHKVSGEASAQLANIYIERLKIWKPPAFPPRQSSRRHRHVPRGSGCYATRPAWLDSIPPFNGTSPLFQRCLRSSAAMATSRHQPASMLGLLQVNPEKSAAETEVDCPCCCCNEDLVKLQSLLVSKYCHASIVSQVLQSVRESLFRGSTSLNLICLDRLEPSVALGLLVDNHIGVVLDYALTTFNGDAGSWTRLLQLMLMVAKDTWKEGKRNEKDAVVLETLKGILEYTSTHLEPQEFIQSLPNDGILSFFLPYLEQSCRRNKVKMLQTQAITMVTNDGVSS